VEVDEVEVGGDLERPISFLQLSTVAIAQWWIVGFAIRVESDGLEV
jgi:hypothetical protein